MPFFKEISIPTIGFISIWEIKESALELEIALGNVVEEKTKVNQKKGIQQLQWLASRLLLKKHFENKKIQLNKNEFNKPSLLIDDLPYHISITHSGKFAAIFISETATIGIDIELIDSRILKISNKFLNETELKLIQNFDQEKTKFVTLIWSAKETLYKIYSQKELDFRKELFIQDLNEPLKAAIFKTDSVFKVDIHHFEIDNYILTYAYCRPTI
jgi:4'-phosphopantetheinyl transferase